jgi:hypothetical protein
VTKRTQNKAKETVKKEQKKKELKPAPEPQGFVSMCGAKFNASPDGTCFLVCKKENKDDFTACLGNYEMLQAQKPAAKKLIRRQKRLDFFGDGVGTSASMINELLVCGATMEEIQNELELKKARITGHFGGLRTKSLKTRPKAYEIFRCKETKRYYIDEPELPYYGDMNEEGCLPVVAKQKTTKTKTRRKSK